MKRLLILLSALALAACSSPLDVARYEAGYRTRCVSQTPIFQTIGQVRMIQWVCTEHEWYCAATACGEFPEVAP